MKKYTLFFILRLASYTLAPHATVSGPNPIQVGNHVVCLIRFTVGSRSFTKKDHNKPTKRSNAQHLVEYYRQFLQEENKKLGNVIQKTMHSYVCGINLRSESSLV